MTILIILGILFTLIFICSIVYKHNRESLDIIIDAHDKYKGRWNEWKPEAVFDMNIKFIAKLLGGPFKIVRKLAWFFR